MRSVVTSVTTLAFLVLASTLAMTKSSCAGTVINACGKFSFWIPDDWTMSKGDFAKVDQSAFESKDGNLFLLVGPLPDKSSELSDDDVTDFVDEAFDDMKVTSDKKDTIEKMDVRIVEGTGTDEGEPIEFKMLAIDAGSDRGIFVALISGSPKDMGRSANQDMIQKILRSLRSQQ